MVYHVPSGVFVPRRRDVVDGALGPVQVPVVPLQPLHPSLQDAARAGRPAPGDLQRAQEKRDLLLGRRRFDGRGLVRVRLAVVGRVHQLTRGHALKLFGVWIG